MGAVARRPGPSLRALLFRCFACARQRWQPAASKAGPAGPAVSLFRMRPAKVAAGSFQSYFSKGFSKQRYAVAPGLGTRGCDQQALLFRCFACARQRWQPAALRATFLRASESNVRQWRLALGHAVGTSRPCCCAVSHAPGKGGAGSFQS